MKTVTPKIFLLVFVFILSIQVSQAQYASRKVSKKQQAYTDSLKTVEYNYLLPILGQQTYSRGFDIPYPVGLMANYIWMKQNIIIENLQLGVQSGNLDVPMQPIDFIEIEVNSLNSKRNFIFG